MLCKNKKCNKVFDDNFSFCPFCGRAVVQIKKETRRPNGTGSIWKRKDCKSKPWAAAGSMNGSQVFIGYFATKGEAVRALQDFSVNPTSIYNITLSQLYEKWIKTKAFLKLSKSAQSGHKSAWNKLKIIGNQKFRDLRTSDFQAIVDYYENPHQERGANGQLKYIDKKGKGTMKKTGKPKICNGLGYSALNTLKALISCLYKFAMKEDLVNKNYAQFLELPSPEDVTTTAFSDTQLELIKRNIGKVPYMDYAYALCYLNFRVSEFLELTSVNFFRTESGVPVLRGGKKTAAGKNRLIPVHPNVEKIVLDCINKKGDTIFCRADGTPMNKDYFLKSCFRPAMQAIGISDDYTPQSCRRTFSTRMSAAGAREEDIIALMGHTDFNVDIKHYIKQEVDTLYKAIKQMA